MSDDAITYPKHVGDFKLRRALGAGTVDMLDQQEVATQKLSSSVAGNMAQQAVVEASGFVAGKPVSTTASVTFSAPFGMGISTAMTDSTMTTPHFTSGVQILGGEGVFIEPQLVSWVTGDNGLYTGCTVKVMAFAPGAPKKRGFSALIHLSFMGYAIPTEEESGG